MSDPGDEHALARFEALARVAAAAPVGKDVYTQGRARLVETAGQLSTLPPGASRKVRIEPPLHARRGRRWMVAVAALAAAAAIGLGIERHLEQPLGYVVRGSASSAKSYVSAPEDAPAYVRFSDGSDVVAQPGTRLRIEETRNSGARVVVERGSATIHVEHERRSRWSFVAGPFEVRVTGTKLTIAWDPEEERIDVTLHEGSVEIETPIGPSRYAVAAGHRFHASVREGMVKMDDARVREQAAKRDDAPGAAAAARGDEAPVAEAAARAGMRAVPPDKTKDLGEAAAPGEPWPRLVGRGAFREVVAAAEGRGVTTCMAKCSSSELRALADAARYTGAPALATQALLALRSRFGDTRHGAAAAFLLGRTAESMGDLAAADRWYTTYLTESPGSELAAEALAGKMLVVGRLGRAAQAKALAHDYLKRYPEGAAVGSARKLAGSD
jgi:TolA-binding protein